MSTLRYLLGMTVLLIAIPFFAIAGLSLAVAALLFTKPTRDRLTTIFLNACEANTPTKRPPN